jgi:hypothetical protein
MEDGETRMEKRCFLPDEPTHKNFYRLGMNCDPGRAEMGLTAHWERCLAKSSQVPFHEPFRHKNRLSQSNLVKASQGVFVNKFAGQSIIPNLYHFSRNSLFRAPKPPPNPCVFQVRFSFSIQPLAFSLSP